MCVIVSDGWEKKAKESLITIGRSNLHRQNLSLLLSAMQLILLNF